MKFTDQELKDIVRALKAAQDELCTGWQDMIGRITLGEIASIRRSRRQYQIQHRDDNHKDRSERDRTLPSKHEPEQADHGEQCEAESVNAGVAYPDHVIGPGEKQ